MYEELKQYCETDTQRTVVDALCRCNSQNEAAKALGVHLRNLQRTLARVRKLAASRGHSPEHDMTQTVPEGFQVKGVSTLYNEDGDVKAQWVKSHINSEEQKLAFEEFIKGLSQGIKGQAKPVKATKKKYNLDLMSLIIIGDAHIGMRSHGDETGAMNFDTDIACEGIREAIDDLISRSPDAETGALVDVGDFMHMNTSDNSTAKGTMVDVDTRYERVLRCAGMVMRYCVDQMLKKYRKVIVVVAKGNHNPDPAIAISLMLQFYYDKEDRVSVLDTIGYHHYLTFGDWLIGVNHGDRIKPQQLVAMMARDHKGWSEARFRVWITGHIHHERTIEINGCVVMSFNTLAPRDAWHASMGYGARQSMTLMTIHKTKGKHSTLDYDLPERAG